MEKIDDWENGWGQECQPDDLCSEMACKLYEFLSGQPEIIGNLRARRREDGIDAVLFDLQVEKPQRPLVSIRKTEPIAVVFSDDDQSYSVLALRPDFPDTDHQNIIPEGIPCSLCIDERPFQEARLTWTPAEMLQRISTWFTKTAHGELHNENQPIDPLFIGSDIQIVIPRNISDKGEDKPTEFFGFFNEGGSDRVVIMKKLEDVGEKFSSQGRIAAVSYTVKPEKMQRLRCAPTTLKGLADMLEERGINLFADLKNRFESWAGTSDQNDKQLSSMLSIIVTMPVTSPDGSPRSGTYVNAYITEKSIGKIGVALGFFQPNISGINGANKGYVKAFPPQEPDQQALDNIRLDMCHVHLAYDREWASLLAGKSEPDDQSIVFVGAGAIGSLVAENLGREGHNITHVIDQDFLLPHNLVRHTLSNDDIGRWKAQAVAYRLMTLTEDGKPVPIVTDICSPEPDKENELKDALTKADVIIDTSASISAARHLSDLNSSARRMSAFFNPTGTAAVLLAESNNRKVNLRDIEALYYKTLIETPELETHLTETGDRFAYTGACRALTNGIPQGRAAILSGLVSTGIAKAMTEDESAIKIWTLTEEGGVTLVSAAINSLDRHEIGDWSVIVDEETKHSILSMRQEKVPNETGGALLGVIDTSAKTIHLIKAMHAPADSQESETNFERGIQGLSAAVSGIMLKTMDNVRYVGEWHSHPPGCATLPSKTDLGQIAWLTFELSIDDCPALMMIAGDEDIRIILAEEAKKIA